MKRVKTVAGLMAAVILCLASVPAGSLAAQDSTSALERGWRTGYSDGYQAGWGDAVENAPRDFKSKADYQSADRAYVAAYGPREDYRDGYQQGFEIGYASGYERRGFDSTIPQGLKRRGTVQTVSQQSTQQPATDADDDDDASYSSSTGTGSTSSGPAVASGGTVTIRRDTVMRVELLTNLSTEASQVGDRFQARVIEPAELEGAMVDGRVTRVKRPGRVKGSSELQLSFEQIRINNRFSNLNAQVIEVIDTPGTGNTSGTVDEEGGVKGKDDSKRDVAKIGTSAAIGAVIGAIVGGGKGAAIGAAIGGGIGTGGVMTQRGNDIYLPRGQQLRIRTNSETRV